MSKCRTINRIAFPNFPLGDRNGFRVGSVAEYFGLPRCNSDVSLLIEYCFEQDLPLRVIGKGTNTFLRSEYIAGMVIALDADCFCKTRFSGKTAEVGAGISLPSLVKKFANRGISKLAPLAGIPGTVGAAAAGNSGSHGTEFLRVCKTVSVVNGRGTVRKIPVDNIEIGYRRSSLEGVVVQVEIGLNYEGRTQAWKRTLDSLDRKLETQPSTRHSLGSIFKNPPGLFAGELIEKCGLRGRQFGSVRVSPKHSNFIVGSRGRKPERVDIVEAIEAIEKAVFRRFKIRLDLEVRIW